MEVQNMPFRQNGSVLHDQRCTVRNWYPSKHISETMDKSAPISGEDLTYTIEPVTDSDADAIIDFLKATFFKDEPLNKSLVLGECKELEKYSLKSIPDNFSFKAVSSSGEIIGVLLNGLVTRPSPDAPQIKSATSCQHTKFKKILGLMDFIDEHFNVFDLYPKVNTILDAKILSVHDRYRGKGVAIKLTQRTLEQMRQNRIPVMHVLCSSEFSARLMAKLDFHKVFTLPYTEYKDNEGVQVLKPDHPHLAACAYVKEIDLEGNNSL